MPATEPLGPMGGSNRKPRLGRYVVESRRALDITQEQLAARAGIGLSTVQSIEGGKGSSRPQMRVREALEGAFDWGPGSVDNILEGREPFSPAGSSSASNPEIELPFNELSFDQLFQLWVPHAIANLEIEYEYGRRRGIQPGAAREELWGALMGKEAAWKEHVDISPPWAGEPEHNIQEEFDPADGDGLS